MGYELNFIDIVRHDLEKCAINEYNILYTKNDYDTIYRKSKIKKHVKNKAVWGEIIHEYTCNWKRI